MKKTFTFLFLHQPAIDRNY